MITPESEFYLVLEQLSKTYPNDEVNMEARRTPEGSYRYCSTLSSNEKLGLKFECGWGDTAREAAENLIKTAGPRDLAVAIGKAITAHEQEIAKLRIALANLALPAWKPIDQLGVGNPPEPAPLRAPAFVNIESEVAS